MDIVNTAARGLRVARIIFFGVVEGFFRAAAAATGLVCLGANWMAKTAAEKNPASAPAPVAQTKALLSRARSYGRVAAFSQKPRVSPFRDEAMTAAWLEGYDERTSGGKK